MLLYKMGYVDFLVFASHSEGKGHLVFDDQLTLLKSGDGCAYLLQFRAAHAKEVFDHLVVDCLLLQDQLTG